MDPLPSVDDGAADSPSPPERAEYHALELGAGRAVVFLHDIFSTHECFGHVMESLADEWRTVGVDLPGHGRSSPPARDADLGTLAGELHDVLVAFGALPAAVVGEGVGATLAALLTLAHPSDFTGLVLVSPTLGAEAPLLEEPAVSAWLGGGGEAAEFVDAVLPRHHCAAFFGTQPGRAGAERARLGSLVAADVSPLAAAVLAAGDLAGTLDRPVVPVRVIVGAEDSASGVERGRDVAAVAGAECIEISGAGHLVSIDQPELLQAAVREFLNGL